MMKRRVVLAVLAAPFAMEAMAASADASGGLVLAQSSARVRVVVIPGRTTTDYTSGQGRRVLERQVATITRALQREPGVVLSFSPDPHFGGSPRVAERLEGLWQEDFTAGRLDVARARAAARAIGAQIAVGVYYAPNQADGGTTTVNVLEVDSGTVFRQSASGQGQAVLAVFRRAFDQALLLLR